MVEDRVTDGRRIAQLLASEVRGRDAGPLGTLSVVDVRDVEGSETGEFAYGIDHVGHAESAGVRLVDVYVHDDRARLEFHAGLAAAAAAADGRDLRARPKATTPPRTLIFVESGVAVKRAADAVGEAAAVAADDDPTE